jgi:tRNA (guanine37-N1)-methyltransferase
MSASLRVHIVTLFPSMFDSWLAQGLVSRAVEAGAVDVRIVDLRPFGVGGHRVTDDYPFGGGSGMVMKPEPLFDAVEAIDRVPDVPVVLLSPRGRLLTQSVVRDMAAQRELILVAGHYEGVDERVREHLVSDEISIGDYVLSCGELPAMVLTDAVSRLQSGVLSDEATVEESFTAGLLEYPQYTRPSSFRGWDVPEVLLSGHHAAIAAWRKAQARQLTADRRPDILADDQTSRDATR